MEKILFVPHPKLRQHAQTIDKVTKKEIIISKKMIEIMKRAPGAGLAANQIGLLQKIITVNIQDYEKETEKVYALFNPSIKSYSTETVVMEEGCLSFPKQFIEIEYTDENNKIIEEKKWI